MHLGAEAGARNRHQVRDHGNGGRIAAGAETRIGRFAAEFTADRHKVLAALRARERRRQRHERRTHRRKELPVGAGRPLRPRDLADGAVELSRVREIDTIDRRDGSARECARDRPGSRGRRRSEWRSSRARRSHRRPRWDRLRHNPSACASFERIGKRQARAVHAGEDVVAGAVQDAGDAQQPIARQTLR